MNPASPTSVPPPRPPISRAGEPTGQREIEDSQPQKYYTTAGFKRRRGTAGNSSQTPIRSRGQFPPGQAAASLGSSRDHGIARPPHTSLGQLGPVLRPQRPFYALCVRKVQPLLDALPLLSALPIHCLKASSWYTPKAPSPAHEYPGLSQFRHGLPHSQEPCLRALGGGKGHRS